MTTGRHLRWPDVLVAAGFVALGQAVTWAQVDSADSFAGPRVLNAAVSLLAMGCLLWRRVAPMQAVMGYVCVACLPHVVIDLDATVLGTAVPLVVLLGSAGYHLPGRLAAATLGIGLAGFAALSLHVPYLRTPEAFAYNAAMLSVAWAAARGLRVREDKAARLGEALATERAEREARLAQGVAEERARIARELHDVVAHAVSVMVVQVGAARMQLGSSPAADTLLEAEDAGRRALTDLRQFLGLLRSADAGADAEATADALTEPAPGLVAIARLVERTRATGLDVDYRVVGTPRQLPQMVELSAYRIVQEALTNVLRHASATRACVTVAHGEGTLVLEVVDDGVAAGDREPGLGLVGIRERAAAFGGVAEIGPLAGAGWRVRVELPTRTAGAPDGLVGSAAVAE